MTEPENSNSPVALMSRLLSDRNLRQRFRDDRQSLIAELTDDPEAAQFLNNINVQQLDAQAETLISKRQHEVAELLPETWQRLGNDAAHLFRVYVDDASWPEGHQRHLLDAQSFAEWLSRTKHPLLTSEANRVRFAVSNRRVAVRLIRDVGTVIGIQILMRQRNGRIRETVPGFRRPLWPAGRRKSAD